MERNRVLLVDDDADFRKALARYLTREVQVEVDQAEDGRSALGKARKHGSQYCAVLLDLVLGTPSGLEVLIQIKRDLPDLPVIVFTGKDMEAGAKALALGAYPLLHKRINPVEIAAAVRNLAEQDRVLHRLAADTYNISGADLCIIWKLDRAAQQFKVAAWDGRTNLDDEYRMTVILDARAPSMVRLFSNGEPILMPDVTDQRSAPYYKYPEAASRRGWISLVSVPLIHQGRTVALLDCYWRRELTFSSLDEQKKMLAMMKGWADRAAESFRASDISNQFQILLGINQVLVQTLEEDQVIDLILSQGLELLGANMGWIYLIDFETRDLKLKGSRGIPGHLLDHTRKLGYGITGRVAESGEALNVSDARNDPHHSPIPDVIIGSEASVPLRREGQVIGALTVMSPFVGNFTNEDINLLSIFASQATLAVERARLNALQRKVSEATVKGESEVIETIVQAVRDLTGNSTSLWVFEPESRLLRIKAAREVDPEFIKGAFLELEGTSTGQAFREHRIISIPDISDLKREPMFKYADKGSIFSWKSALIVPLFDSKEQPLGALCVYGKIIQDFSQWEKDLLASFANQAASAFENARLLEVEKGALEVSNLVSATLDQKPDNVAARSLELIQQVIPFKRASIQLFEGDKRRLVAGIGFNLETADPWLVRPVSTDMVVMQMMKNQKLIRLDDTNQFEGWDPLPGVQAWVGIPLIDEGQMIGILTLDHDQPGFFASYEEMIFKLLGNQVAIAIQKSRLLNDLQKKNARLEMLNEFSRKISSSLQEKRIYDLVTEGLVKTLNCTHSTMFIREGNRLNAVSSKAEQGFTTITHSFNLGDGLAGWVAQEGKPALTNDAKHDSRFVPGLTRTDCDRSMIVVPVKWGSEVIGVISVDQDCLNAFTEDDRKLVETLAWQTGVSLHTAYLYRQEQQIGKISRLLLKKNLNLDRILEIILINALSLTKTESGVIYLIDRGHTRLVGSFEYPSGFSHPVPRFTEK